MQKRIILRTLRKIGSFFGFLAVFIGGMFLTAWAGKIFFNDPFLGNVGFILIGCISGLFYFSYNEAKVEIQSENNKLIQELTRNG